MNKKSFYDFFGPLAYATPYGPDLQAPGIIDGVKENDDTHTHYYELLFKIAYTTAYVVLTTEEALKVYELENTGHYTEDDNFTDETLAYFLELFYNKYADSLYDQYKTKGEEDIPKDVQKYIINRKASYDNRKRT